MGATLIQRYSKGYLVAKHYIHILGDVAIDYSLLSLKAMTDKIGLWLALRIAVMWRTFKKIKAIKKKRKADKKKKGKGKKKKKSNQLSSSLARKSSVVGKDPPKKSNSKLGTPAAGGKGSKADLSLSATKMDEV